MLSTSVKRYWGNHKPLSLQSPHQITPSSLVMISTHAVVDALGINPREYKYIKKVDLINEKLSDSNDEDDDDEIDSDDDDVTISSDDDDNDVTISSSDDEDSTVSSDDDDAVC